MTMRFLFPLVTALLLAPSYSPAVAAEDAAPKTTAEAQAPAIIVTPAVSEKITDRILANGIISAMEDVLVAPQIEGLAIESLEADVGDWVEAGSVLAKLSDDQLVLQRSQLKANRLKALAAIAQMNAQLTEVRSTADETVKTSQRARALAEQGTFSTVQAEQAEAQATAALARIRSVEESVKVAQADIQVIDAQMKDIELRLARTEVKAPVSGVVTARGARVGAIASAASGPMFSIIKDGVLELRADVAEPDMHRIAVGQTVKIQLIGTTQTREGTIRLIEPSLNMTTRLGLARIEIKDMENLRAGMFADAEIIVASRDALVVPVTAVSANDRGTTVLKVNDGIAKRTAVQTGIREAGVVEIVSGLSQGDLIVAKAGAFVRDGDRIVPTLETDSGTVAAINE